MLDDRLKHPNSAVVMACIQVFINFTKDIDNLAEDVYKRIKGLCGFKDGLAFYFKSCISCLHVFHQFKPSTLCVSGNFSSMDAALKNVTAKGNSYCCKEKTACYPFVIHSKTFSKPFKVIDNVVVQL